MAKRNLKFKTETQKLLHLVIHSLYSHSEIFMRELVSNASDAIDRLRFLMLSDKKLAKEKKDFKIKIIPDKDKRLLTISDNGIGMTEKELIENMGTIARSGTSAFLSSLQEGAKNIPEMIGQFGVGFYSAFMVADKVRVITKKANEEQAYSWESEGEGSFNIDSVEKKERGTEIILHIKEDAEFDQYLDNYQIKTIIKKYSDFIEYPIVMDVERPVEGKEDEKKIEEEVLNSQKAIWMRSTSEIKKEEYTEFYKHISHDFQDYLEHIHYKVEGVTEFNALLYLPAHMPYDLMFAQDNFKGVQLYVKRVFIMDDAEALMPRYLRFVKGVVDSSDLPLNVSREILQQDRVLKRIKTNLVKKVLDTLKKLKDEQRDKYVSFFKELGPILKEGIALDFENKDKLMDLLLFESSKTKAGEYTSLTEYVANMQSGQKTIYYIAGESRQDVENSPYLESLKEKGYEILFLTEAIDELIAQHLHEYQEKKFQSASKGEIAPEDEAEKEKKKEEISKKSDEFKGLVSLIQEQLADNVKEVKLSTRMVSSPACLVADEMDMSANMERIMRGMHQKVPKVKRIMEINPDHNLINLMQKLYEKTENGKNEQLSELVTILYNQAVIAEGGKVANPGDFAKTLTSLLEEKAQSLA